VARILIACWGSYGDINPYLGLALGLRARGHDPLIAAPYWSREYVEREGVPHASLRPAAERSVMALSGGFLEAMRSGLRDAYDDLRALAPNFDLLVTQPSTLAGPIVAEELGMPWVSTVVSPLSFYSVHDTLFAAPAGWVRDLPPGAHELGAFMVPLVRLKTQAWVEPVHALRAEIGLPRAGHPLFEGQHSPHRVLALFPQVLAAPQPDWPQQVTITGAILFNANAGRALPAEVSEFLGAGDAPIVFTLGSSAIYSAGDFYDESAKVCAELDRRGVLIVGRPENRPRALPRGVIAVDEAPHALLFRHASAIVHHAGIGTLNQALYAGRPMLTVPFRHDQPDNARRARQLGVARTLQPSEYKAAAVAHELQTLLDEPSYAERAAAVGKTVAEEYAVAAATRAIEAELPAA
jgi:UDP:flavonoid glycosyltransferase YjiC (YdhE family)